MTAPQPDDTFDVYRPEFRMLEASLRRPAMEDTAPADDDEKHRLLRVTVLTLAAILTAKKGHDWLASAKEWEERGRYDAGRVEEQLRKEFKRKLSPLVSILSGVLLVGRGGVGKALGVQVVGSAAAESLAEAWARNYVDKVGDDFARTSAAALAIPVAEWLARPLPAAAMALRARELYGLDARAVNAANAYADRPVAETKRRDRKGLIERYLEHRVLQNATVWMRAAHNAGKEMAFAEMLEAGLISDKTLKVWVTARDERVCPICGPMDNVGVKVGDTFRVKGGSRVMTPPIHPHCRCTIQLSDEPTPGMVYGRRFDLIPDWLSGAVRSIFR